MIPQSFAGVTGALADFGPALANHLWQSTVFVVVAGVLTLALRKNHARARYWIWMAASVKFLIPFALLITIGSHLAKPHQVAATQAGMYVAMEDVSEPFALPDMPVLAAPVAKVDWAALLPVACGVVWLGGFAAVLCLWCVRWRRVAAGMREAVAMREGRELDALRRLEVSGGLRSRIELVVSSSAMEPGVFGIARPILAWPARISERLDDAHLVAVLAHEVCHVRRRDNLTAAIHMVVEAVFWFYPLVWWLGARLVEERERACDEEVLELCKQPEVYAESILTVCEFCVESPLACVSGVTGADLKRRIVEIMTERVVCKLGLGRKLLLVAVGLAVVSVPILLGQVKGVQRIAMDAVHSAPAPIRAAVASMASEAAPPASNELAGATQSAPDTAAAPMVEPAASDHAFEVATIRVADRNDGRKSFGVRLTPSGRLEGSATTVSQLVGMAYGGYASTTTRVDGGPDWLRSTVYDIVAKLDDADMVGWDNLSDKQRKERVQPMIRRLLADRFHLQLRTEMRDVPGYALVQVKGGAKLKEVPPPPINQDAEKNKEMNQAGKSAPGSTMYSDDGIVGTAITGASLALFVQVQGRRDGPVVDETGLKGYYDFVLKPESSDPSSFVDAVQDQLGLKLVPRKISVKTYIIDSAEKPSVDGAEVQEAAGVVPVALVQQKAQAPETTTPHFEVASVRRAAPAGSQPSSPGMARTTGVGFVSVTSDRASYRDITLKSLLMRAYDLKPFQISGPAWIDSERYDIVANIPEGSTKEDVPVMLQHLLADRFRMTLHSETKEHTGYSLGIGKGGPKLIPAKNQNSAPSADPDASRRPASMSFTMGGNSTVLKINEATMPAFADFLSRTLGSTVIDSTGLPGKFDIALPVSMGVLSFGAHETGADGSPVESDSSMASLFTAVHDLGLTLDAEKVPLKYIVVDKAEKIPTEN